MLLPIAAALLLATPMTPQTRAELIKLREAIRGWAPLCNGTLSTTPDCNQFDALEYAGMSCAAGETARCNDVKLSQAADGRWWRNPTAAHKPDEIDSFSRDMLMGVFDYALVTKDHAAFDRYYHWLRDHGRKMCPHASDNRCHLLPGTWGIFGWVMKALGSKRPLLITVAAATVDADLLLAAEPPAVQNFQRELVAHHILVRRLLGQNTGAMREAARRIAKAQPLNPLFVYLHDGPTEEAAKLTQEICKSTRGSMASDIFFQRGLKRDSKGVIVVIRDFHDPVPPPARELANGHDCLIVIGNLLK